jgi:hypothetical protein
MPTENITAMVRTMVRATKIAAKYPVKEQLIQYKSFDLS